MTAFTYPLPQGVISAQLSERIQTVVQQAMDDQRLYARAGVSCGMDASSISLEENLRRIASVPLLFEPGTQWRYSLATDVLGALVARIQGVPLGDAIQQLVTGPLAMLDTGFTAHDPQRAASAYVNGLPPLRLGEGECVRVVEDTAGIDYRRELIFDAGAFPLVGAGLSGRFVSDLRDAVYGGLAVRP